MARNGAVYLLHSFILWLCVTAQSPGDYDETCKDISVIPDYSINVKALMDSWGYLNLVDIDGGPWTLLDLDENKTSNWEVIEGETCREKLRTNEPVSVPQNNWVVTQYINKTIAPQHNTYDTYIYVNISYILDTVCEVVSCASTFQLKYFITNNPTDSGRLDPNNYTLLGSITSDSGIPKTKKFKFRLTPENTGFYLGVVDQGANITLSRLLVYRIIGPAMQVDLTLFPESPAPIDNSTVIKGACAANANVTNGQGPLLTLTPQGQWSDSQQCHCIEGHEPITISVEGLTETECQACVTGRYKSGIGNSACKVCPGNSMSSDHGSAICNCEDKYYRAPDEGPDMACTAPPSNPLGLSVLDIMNTTAVLSWDPPNDNGGRNDTFYDIYLTMFGSVTSEKFNTTATSFTLTGLSPYSYYPIRLVSGNGVSSQDPNENSRSVTSGVFTEPGVPTKVENVKVVYDDLVEWMSLNSSRGPILGYEVQFISNKDTGPVISVSADDTVYSPNVTMDFPPTGHPVHVRVRGCTIAGPGEWSDPTFYVEVNPIAPPITSSPSITITTSNIAESSNSQVKASSTSSTTTPGGTTPTGTAPTDTSSNNGALSIGLSIAAVIGIITIVTLLAVGFYIFRKVRDRWIRTEGTDGGEPLVKYSSLRNEDADGDTDGEGMVEVNPGEGMVEVNPGAVDD